MRKIIIAAVLLSGAVSVHAQQRNPYMSEGYYRVWTDSLQAAIDADIERYRKADTVILLPDVRPGSRVKVEQTGHEFLFGSNIFLFGQLGSQDRNSRYEDCFGTLFNGATVPFYWKTLEPEKGHPRYTADSPGIYRRPAPDPVVEFCLSKGIRMKGHALIYGIRSWGHPEWMPEDRDAMDTEFEKHIRDIASRYGGTIPNWDVVNESLDQHERGLMPDDYTWKCYDWAMRCFPEGTTFNTNECDLRWGPQKRYVRYVRDLVSRGIKIDYVGVQMHIFDPREADLIARGEYKGQLMPDRMAATLDVLKDAGRPIYISEVTVSAPDSTERGRQIQKEIARNLYRFWFSRPEIAGITWWNLADGGAAPGEPSWSGLLDVGMRPKPSYEALDRLINHEWKTSLELKAGRDGTVRFRGFRGSYRITYKNRRGKIVVLDTEL